MYKEKYVPKKGDIVKIVTDNRTVLAVHDKYNHYQAIALLAHKQEFVDIEIRFGTALTGDIDSHEKATPEESEVMHHILSENGYALIGDRVVKNRWIPEMGDLYYYVGQRGWTMKTIEAERRNELDSAYLDCFKTEQACQSACDKINELLLTLPQE